MREKLIENDIITIFAAPERLLLSDEEEATIYSVSVEVIVIINYATFLFWPMMGKL